MLDNYDRNDEGLIYQINPTPITYDHEYVASRYDTYGELNGMMSHLRLGYIVGALGRRPESICDVGYGNGAFLKACRNAIPDRYGFDVTDYPVPQGVRFTKNWLDLEVDVLTFFDVLEHFEDPYVLRQCRAENVVISLPWCHYESDEWFDRWKHRRPNEHLWHFDLHGMTNFARVCGFKLADFSDVEDIIRRPETDRPNILTVLLKRA